MNKKGFAVSGILYTVLVIFLTSMVIILFNLQNRKTILDELKLEAVEAVEEDNNYEALLEKVQLLETEVNTLKNKSAITTLWSGSATIGSTITLSDSYKNYKFLIIHGSVGYSFAWISGSNGKHLSWGCLGNGVNASDTNQEVSIGYGLAKINSDTSLTILNSGFIYSVFNVSSFINNKVSADGGKSITTNQTPYVYSPRSTYAIYGIK